MDLSAEEVIRLITPLIIGGIAGLTVTCTLFPRVFDLIEKEADKRENKTKNIIKNEGLRDGVQAAVNEWAESRPYFHNNEKWVLQLFGLSIIVLILPFLYAVRVPYIDLMSLNLFNIPIVGVLIISAYACIIFALGLLIKTYSLMAILRESLRYVTISVPSEDAFKFLKMMGPP